MDKDKWIPVYDGDGKHFATVNSRGEMKSLGYSDESPPHVALEIRAAELALDASSATPAENDGYMAHVNGFDPEPDGWAGWLEREIGIRDLEIISAIASTPEVEPSPGWDERVVAAIDEADRDTLDGIDQSDPVVPEAPLVEAVDIHSEPTHVAEVDSRFDQTEEV